MTEKCFISDLYFPNISQMRKLNLRERSAFISLNQYAVERNSVTWTLFVLVCRYVDYFREYIYIYIYIYSARKV